jgi:hypothetical protein
VAGTVSQPARDLERALIEESVITNDVSDSYQSVYVIAHIICNHPVYEHRAKRILCILLTTEINVVLYLV